jgi:glutamate--cysteine ligase
LSPIYFGVHPFAEKNVMSLVPKKRYEFMYPYMGTVGSMGQEMMKLTSSVQVTIDYGSEADAMHKLWLAFQLTPYFIAISANSSMVRGDDSGFASYRSHIWTDTDNARSGYPAFLSEMAQRQDIGFEAYINWALDVPVYFLYRENELVPDGKRSFWQLIQEKEAISLSDWELHLSTLFPWVRLRDYIEIRSFDLGEPDLQVAYAALVWGIFYSPHVFDELRNTLELQNLQTTLELTGEAIKRGLASDRIKSMSAKIVTLAEEGLVAADKKLLIPLKDKL